VAIKKSEHAGRERVVEWLYENGEKAKKMAAENHEFTFWNIYGRLVFMIDYYGIQNPEVYHGFEILIAVDGNKIDSTVDQLENLKKEQLTK